MKFARWASNFLKLLMLSLSSTFPTVGRADTPAPAALPPVTLANGLRVLTRERHVTPLVAIDLWVRAGAREETREEDGCAHFLEHTLFKGTTTRQAGDVDIAIENLGGTLNAATGADYAHFYTTVPAVHLNAALMVVADVVRHATLPDAEIQRERGVILDELAAHDSSPTARLIDALYQRAFPAHTYGHSPGGSVAAIQARGRDTLAAFYARTYRPDRCTLALVGDLTSAQAEDAARQAFGSWAKSAVISLPQGSSALPPERPAARFVETAFGPRNSIGLAFPAPPTADVQMRAAACLAETLIGDAKGGRLSLPRFAATDAACHFTPRRDPGLFLLIASATPECSPSALEAALTLETERLRAAPLTAPELSQAKGRLLGRLFYETETAAGLAYALGYADITGGEPPETFRRRVQSLTARDVQQFALRYLAAPVVVGSLRAATAAAGTSK